MAKTKIAVLWGVLIAMMVACAGIYATLKAREMNPYIGGTSLSTTARTARTGFISPTPTRTR